MKKSELRKLIINEVYKALKEDEKSELEAILKDDYPTFVQKLGDNIKDPKFKEAIKSLADTTPIKTTDIAADVKKLKPTQNEIAADKSLNYPLTDPATAEAYLKGGTVAPGGKKIVTGGGGAFIVDGHHRWSQVYVINPDCKIEAMDISNIKNPMAALKATQLGIAGNIGKVPTAKAGGVDMLKSGEAEIKKFVIDKITDPVVDVFKKYKKGNTKEEIANFIWGNVAAMQKNNSPVAGAPKRDIMPQTDDAPTWKDDAPALAESKRIQFLAGLITESEYKKFRGY